MKDVALVAGAIANKPFSGGAAWTRLSWILGLRQLGFDVYFLEEMQERDCVDAQGRRVDFERSANLQFFRLVAGLFGLSNKAALILNDGRKTVGLKPEEVREAAASAQFLLNISGHLKQAAIIRNVPLRIYLDLDPGYTQIWQAQQCGDLGLENHHVFFTVGENIGSPGCLIPTCGITWHPSRQPVILDEWGVSDQGRLDWLTTVASWRGPYGQLTYASEVLGPKAHQFRKWMTLPERCIQNFEVALDIHPTESASIELLRSHGWHVVDPVANAGDPIAFREYIQNSGAEFSVAQGMYVQTRSGWFGDRTVRYLASGKPALVQNTGFDRRIPTGEGLLAFTTFEEAVAGVERIYRDYRLHCRRAREIAEEYFDSRKVLGRFLEIATTSA
jgi:hypothetical protein